MELYFSLTFMYIHKAVNGWCNFHFSPLKVRCCGLPDSGQSGVECLDTRRNVWLEDFPLPREVLWMQRVTSRDVAYF